MPARKTRRGKKTRRKVKRRPNLKNRVSRQLFGRPYSWLDAHEAQEVKDYIRYRVKKR